jgi:hypothetical protein
MSDAAQDQAESPAPTGRPADISFAEAFRFWQMGWFFTKAALLTFGGAYAVLPYVYQARSSGHRSS